ncbi:glycosyltransferase [Haloplasma contractile]|uniref:Glycoprotein 3-alpha-L-fucosyltransferase n=1 Tax=Haloplasma contractile SSD-17B TaxID=1033810 RepID=F7PVA2_9MOLU|nr:glycosyltransferase [Haloplasma contractile]ERJ12933.1 glycoprotein 3-alpha-L-fucosyltransferase [Haloplasma contractile SSD-17B]
MDYNNTNESLSKEQELLKQRYQEVIKRKNEEILELKRSKQYRLGNALLLALKPSRHTILLPYRLFLIFIEAIRMRDKKNYYFQSEKITAILEKYNLLPLKDDILDQIEDLTILEMLYFEGKFNHHQKILIGKHLFRRYRETGSIHDLIFFLNDSLTYHANHERYLRELDIALNKLALLKQTTDLNTKLNYYKNKQVDFKEELPARVLHVLNVSLPYRKNGYSIRSSYIIDSQRALDIEPVVITRPGFPNDFKRNSVKGKEGLFVDSYNDTMYYRCLPNLFLRKAKLSEYIIEFSKQIEHAIEKVEPCVVHSSSNFVIGLAGYLAAMAKDLPFVYEIRGFWELTTASKEPGFYESDEYNLHKYYETFLAIQANKVVVISHQLKKELINRGVKEEKITVIPNGVDPVKFKPMNKSQTILNKYKLNDQYIIGYIGSIVKYEGLERILELLSRLKEDKIDNVCFVLIGRGKYMDELKTKAKELNVYDQVKFIGQVPHDEVISFYSTFDVSIYPRFDFEVTRMVTPLKPLEAIACGVPCIVSDLPAMREIVCDGENGLVFDHSAKDLYKKFMSVYNNKELRESLKENGRAMVTKYRDWSYICRKYSSVYVNHETN